MPTVYPGLHYVQAWIHNYSPYQERFYEKILYCQQRNRGEAAR